VDATERVISSRRGHLVLRAVGLVALGVAVGSALQSWDVLRTSALGRFGEASGIPMIALVITILAAWIAMLVIRDNWYHRITLGSAMLTVRDSLGTYSVPYSSLTDAKVVPMMGVVLAFRDREQWLNRSTGSAEIRRRTSDLLRAAHQGDVLFSRQQLGVSPSEFVALLLDRAPGMQAEGVQQRVEADEARAG
jgi:hypothetical protein